jgi:hypothetical protein
MKRILSVTFSILMFSMLLSNVSLAQSINFSKSNLNIASGVPVKGTIASEDAKDTYYFSTNADGEVYITLDETTGGFSAYLYDENGESLGGNYYSSRGSEIVISNNVQKGNYYIEVEPYGWDGITSASYKLKATFASTFTRDAKTFETNDTNETSLPVRSGLPYKSKSESSVDMDVYQFTTNKDGEVYITLDETTGGYSMYLYDTDGNNLGGNYYSSKGSKIVIERTVKKGKYFIKVEPYGWNGITDATYRLKATYAGIIKRNSSSFEPNDTIETSKVAGDGVLYKSKSESSIDQDVYQFTTNKDGEVYITLDQTTAGYSMYLYDIDGNSLGGNYYSSKGNTVVIEKNVKRGKYFVKIAPYGWNGASTASYRFKATYPGTIKRSSSSFEPNETIDTALPIKLAKSYYSSSYSSVDQDVYKLTLTKSRNTSIILDKTTAGFSMYVYDNNGNSVGGNYYSSRGNTINIEGTLARGSYFIKIAPYGWSGTTNATYRVRTR